MVTLSVRRWRADGSEIAEVRRRGSQELLARCEGDGRWLIADDATKEERTQIAEVIK